MNQPVSGSPAPAGLRRWAWPVAIVLALLLLALAVWWWTSRLGGGSTEQREQLRALLDKQQTLEAELAQAKPANPADCPPGQSLKPLAAGPGAAPGLPPAAASGPAGPASQGAPAASEPARTAGLAPALDDAALAHRLEQATAIVLVDGGQQGTGMGTGFFISPTLIVTNRHVVEASATPRVFVGSKALGTLRRATVIKLTRNADIGNPDFALLRMEDGTSAGALDLAPEAAKLSGVVAAGYPAVVVQNDVNFQKLVKGDLSAAPDLNLTKGSVQSLQPGPGGTPLMVHTASIAKGNSGGPLVDGCGRVVGVNTFINVDQSQSAKINYAIRSPAVAEFVQAAGAAARMDTRSCAAKG